ncbi:hypothetical protein HDU98_010468 [Podochytrium sp. JEL0797]|nr:hypothetical protein HDU98_010468 [Podochytrium sp. JEL0797]
MLFLFLFVLLLFSPITTTTANPNAREYLESIYSKAKRAYADRDFSTAVTHFAQLHQHLPDWHDNYYNWAMAELFSNRIGEAFEVLDLAVKQFPDDAQVYSKYCGIIASMLNQPNDFLNVDRFKPVSSMVSICLRSTTLDPQNPQALLTLASLLTLLREYRASIQVWETWLSTFHPPTVSLDDVLSTRTSFAETLVRNGEYARADALARETMEMQPENFVYVQKLAYVRKIGFPVDREGWKLVNQSLHMQVDGWDALDARFCGGGSGMSGEGMHKKWRVALNYSQEAILHPDRISVTHLNPLTTHAIYGSLQDPTFIGPILPKYPHLYHERSIHLIHFSTAFMSGHPGIIHGNCTLYTGSHHINTDLQTFPPFSPSHPVIPLDFPVAHIIQHQIRNYYHWILESLPKLLLLQKHLLTTNHLHSNDSTRIRILIPEPGISACIDATLNLPEFDSLRPHFIHYLRPSSNRYHFRKGLYLVDWIHPQDDTVGTLEGNLWSVYWPPREAIQLVREFWHTALKRRNLFPDLSGSVSDEGTIVWVSRAGSVRGFPNESEFLEFLRTRLGSRLVIHTGQEDMIEQSQIFARARIVAGTHGAGLVNFAFTQPGAGLVMVPMDPHVEFCFGHLVAAVGGRHWVVSGVKGAHYHGTYGELGVEEMEVLVGAIEGAWESVMAWGEGGVHVEL